MNANERCLMQSAADEILALRRQNEIMGAKLEIVDLFAEIFGSVRPPQGMTEDIVGKIHRALYLPEEKDDPECPKASS